MSKTNSPEGLDLRRAQWETMTWLMVSKEARKRRFFNDDAYNERGLLKQSACPEMHREVYSKYTDVEIYSLHHNITPVIHKEFGTVSVEWTTQKDADRKQRMYDGW